MEWKAMRLAGAHEVRLLLGVSRQRLYQLAARSDFPEPVATLAQGKIWSIGDIEKWLADHRGPRAAAHRRVAAYEEAAAHGEVAARGEVTANGEVAARSEIAPEGDAARREVAVGGHVVAEGEVGAVLAVAS
ncbi:helix-turn-helix transcriptional regulator [Paractinoplanes rhizophilus]|uniref:Helix-turn-helix transcriptional regulator n=1 Tax=Paractinoplanes rhizophilus TaxID=1416877 RepID=A0ABW2I3I4_9ACTN